MSQNRFGTYKGGLAALDSNMMAWKMDPNYYHNNPDVLVATIVKDIEQGANAFFSESPDEYTHYLKQRPDPPPHPTSLSRSRHNPFSQRELS